MKQSVQQDLADDKVGTKADGNIDMQHTRTWWITQGPEGGGYTILITDPHTRQWAAIFLNTGGLQVGSGEGGARALFDVLMIKFPVIRRATTIEGALHSTKCCKLFFLCCSHKITARNVIKPKFPIRRGNTLCENTSQC